MYKLLIMTCATAAMIVAVPTVKAEDAYVSTAGNHSRTGATNFIDTAWTVTPQTRVELDYALLEDWDSSLGSVYLFGGSGNSPWFTSFINNGYIGFHNGRSWITSIKPAGANTADVRFTAILDNANGIASVMCNGEVAGSVQTAAVASYGTKTLKIASHVDLDYFAAIKIYGLRIYEAGEKKRDYTPLVKGGVAGLRDSVTGVFLGGVGLTASANTPTEEDDPYLATTGNSGNSGESLYVDTLWKVTASTRFELDYALLDDFTGSESWYLFSGSSETPWFTAFINGNASSPGAGFANGTSGGNTNWKTGHLGVGANAKGVRHTAIVDNANNWVGIMTAGLTNSQAAATSAASFQSGTIKIASHVNKKNFAPIKIYGYRIFENGVKLHDYTPMRKGGQLGFKDSVTGAFFADEHTILLTAGGNLPEEQEDAYVATPANNSAYYIDTEYGATSNTCFMLDCALLTEVSGSTYGALFCGAGSVHFMGFINPSPSIAFGVQTAGADSGIVGLDVANQVGIRRTFVLDTCNRLGYATTAGLTNGIKTTVQSTERSSNPVSIKIGANFNGASNYASLKIYGCKIYEKGMLVRDFVPCVREGCPGLLDKLTDLFVSYPPNKKRETATVLSVGGEGLVVKADPYIEGSGANGPYLVTDYKPCGYTRAEIDFTQTSFDTAVTHYPFSIHGGGDNFLFAIYAFNQNGRWGNICQDSSAVWTHDVNKSPTQTLARVRLILDAKNSKYIAADAGVTNAIYTIPGTRTGSNRATHYLPIFATHDFAAASRMPMRLYSFKIYEDDVLVRDYVPAVKNGVAGLQDQLPGGLFLAPPTGTFTYGGAFPASVTQSSTKVGHHGPVTLTASASEYGAMSYRWLKNGEPVEGGTNGTLTVAWSKGESTDVYQAIACYVIDGYVAESKVSAELAVRNLPTGAVILIK